MTPPTEKTKILAPQPEYALTQEDLVYAATQASIQRQTPATRSVLSTIMQSGGRLLLFAATGAAIGAGTGALGAVALAVDISAATTQGAIGGAILNGFFGLLRSPSKFKKLFFGEAPVVDKDTMPTALVTSAFTSPLENMTGQAILRTTGHVTTSLGNAAATSGVGFLLADAGFVGIFFLIAACLKGCAPKSPQNDNTDSYHNSPRWSPGPNV
jgi:hypothetical protein